MPTFQITSANARELQAKSTLARLEAKAALALAKASEAQFPQIDPYLAKRLSRVRIQVESLNKLLDTELDPQKIDRLVNAIYRLTELERVIAGRPLPGSYKPTPQRRAASNNTQATLSPLVDEPPNITTPPQAQPYTGPENG